MYGLAKYKIRRCLNGNKYQVKRETRYSTAATRDVDGSQSRSYEIYDAVTVLLDELIIEILKSVRVESIDTRI